MSDNHRDNILIVGATSDLGKSLHRMYRNENIFSTYRTLVSTLPNSLFSIKMNLEKINDIKNAIKALKKKKVAFNNNSKKT